MAQQIRVLDRGSKEPRIAYVTRFIALRLSCDARVTAMHAPSWVYLLALDRDSMAVYAKHSQDPESAPWSSETFDSLHNLKVCGVRMAISGEGEMREILSADDPDALPIPWWDQTEEAEEAERRKRDRRKREDFLEWEKRRAQGEADEDDKPKISKYAEAKLRKQMKEQAQAPLDIQDPNADKPRDIDDHE
jgi:hypothetical protein